MTDKDKDRIECAIRHIDSCLDVDPWARDIAIDAMKAQLSQEGTTKGTTSDCISRRDAIDAMHELMVHWYGSDTRSEDREIKQELMKIPSVQPEPAIPLRWIEAQIDWLKSLDNAFSALTAGQILAMVNKWKEEQDE